MLEPITESEVRPRHLSLGCKAIVMLMVIVTAGLCVGAAVAVRAHQVEKQRRRATARTLYELARDLDRGSDEMRDVLRLLSFSSPSSPRAAELRGLLEGLKKNFCEERKDAWGNPIAYRRPGPIHTRGYDLVSFGRNGVDEGGHGDDVVVGKDESDGSIGQFQVLGASCKVICDSDPKGDVSTIEIQCESTSCDQLAKVETAFMGRLEVSLVLRGGKVRHAGDGWHGPLHLVGSDRLAMDWFFEFGKRAQGRGARLLVSGPTISEDFPVMDERGRPFWELVGADFPDDLESTEAH